MFTQKQIAEAFGVTSQAITIALRGAPSIEKPTEKIEGRRIVARISKFYPEEWVFKIAVRSGKLPQYKLLCAQSGIAAKDYHISRDEVSFGERLRNFAPANLEIISQFRIDGYRLDFYFPDISLAIEYDERYHRDKRQSRLDMDRQHTIQKAHGITFIRVIQGSEDAGLFAIASAILTCRK